MHKWLWRAWAFCYETSTDIFVIFLVFYLVLFVVGHLFKCLEKHFGRLHFPQSNMCLYIYHYFCGICNWWILEILNIFWQLNRPIDLKVQCGQVNTLPDNTLFNLTRSINNNNNLSVMSPKAINWTHRISWRVH